MKIYNRLFIGTSLCLAVCSCADQGLLPFPGELQVPDELTQNANLQEYDILKNYVNRTDNPGFKLGIAVDENDFINRGAAFSIAQTNFDDVTPGNAMKYSSVVKDDGTMDFSTVESFIETAEAAGLTVYGHTLCWHAQQNLNYLNGLLKGTSSLNTKRLAVSRADDSNKYCLKLTGGSSQTQAFYQISGTFPSGTYTFSCKVKSSTEITGGNLLFQTTDHTEGQDASYGAFSSSTSWSTLSKDITILEANNNKFVRFFIQFNADPEDYVLIDDMSLTRSGDTKNYIENSDFETGKTQGWDSYGNNVSIFDMSNDSGSSEPEEPGENLITNGSFDSDDMSSFVANKNCATNTFGEDGPNGRYYIFTPEQCDENYSSQFAIKIPEAKLGDKYKLSFYAKATAVKKVASWGQSVFGTNLGYDDIANATFTTEWEKITSTFVIDEEWVGMQHITFNLGETDDNGAPITFYFDEIVVEKISSGTGGGDMTDEEKRNVIYAALEKWIMSMMDACKGRVKVWDVVNEPISGGGNVDGYYELWSASNSDDPTNNFYWQDYLGDDEFVRDAVKLARKYFAENGGNPNDLKLFVNDYNLESDWDTNKKLRSLIYWIDRWENNGEVYIDGIGTQMHVSCSVKEDTQKSRENAVENMFKLMAQTNKLIKISEIDMGITDEDNKKIMTSDVTLVHLLRMADYYNFIIRKYFEIIPQAQRYGITHWSITDAGDEELAWRQGEPIGLWTKEYERKPAYAGFADGLAGVEKSYLGWASSGNSTTGENPSDDVEE